MLPFYYPFSPIISECNYKLNILQWQSFLRVELHDIIFEVVWIFLTCDDGEGESKTNLPIHVKSFMDVPLTVFCRNKSFWNSKYKNVCWWVINTYRYKIEASDNSWAIVKSYLINQSATYCWSDKCPVLNKKNIYTHTLKPDVLWHVCVMFVSC